MAHKGGERRRIYGVTANFYEHSDRRRDRAGEDNKPVRAEILRNQRASIECRRSVIIIMKTLKNVTESGSSS